MRSFITTLTLLFCLINIYGQQYNHQPNFINPSPQAASLGVYGNVNASLSSGAASTSVPLFSLKEQSLNLDISLAYNYSGYRPSDPGGVLGIGWNLLAGGVITRNINGMPDEHPSGFMNVGQLYSSNGPSNQLINDLSYGIYDGSPDLFTFNFMGYSGTFFFGNDGQIHLKEKKPFKIFYESSGTNPPGYPFSIPHKQLARFIVKTDDGVTYVFQDIELSRVTGTGGAGTDHPSSNQITSWYLSKVIGINGEIITFNYIRRGGDETNISESISEKRILKTPEIPNAMRIVQNKTFEVHLSSIEGSLWNVNFEYTSKQGPPPSGSGTRYFRSLDRIILSDKTSEQKRFEFTYSNETHRHLLKSITEKSATQSAKPYLFDYYDELSLYPKSIRSIDKWGYYNGKPNSTSMIAEIDANRNPDFTYARTFALNKITYPTGGTSTISYAANTYSYLNGNAYVENVEQTQTYLFQWSYENSSWRLLENTSFYLAQSTEAVIDVAYTPVPDPKPHQCMEEHKVVWLSAGWHDANDYEFPTEQCRNIVKSQTSRIDFTVKVKKMVPHGYGGTPLTAGGIRVSQIINNPIDSPEEIISYTINNFQSPTNSSGSILNLSPSFFELSINGFAGKYYSSEPLNLMSRAPVIYNNITELKNSAVYKRHYFSAFGGETPGGVDNYGFTVQTGFTISQGQPEFFGPADDFSFLRGLPLKTIHFNNLPGIKSLVEKNQYALQYDLETSPTAYKTYAYHNELLWWEKVNNVDYPIYALKKYTISSVWPRLQKRTDSTFTHTGEFMAATSTEYLYDNPVHQQVTQTKTSLSDGSYRKVVNKYPNDYTGTIHPVYQAMIDSNRVNTRIESLQYLVRQGQADQLYDATISTFKTATGNSRKSSLIVPYKLFRMASPGPGAYSAASNSTAPAGYREILDYTHYNTYGNPEEITWHGTSTLALLWGYKGQFVVAQANNATRSDLNTALSGIGQSFTSIFNLTNEATLRSHLNNLATQPALSPAALTLQTFHPVYGLASLTTPEKNTGYFDYDKLGRLSSTRNISGNLTGYWRYRYFQPNGTKNHIISYAPRVAATDTNVLNNSGNAVIEYNYIGGLGQALQTVAKGNSPLNKDVITSAVQYDNYRRPYKQFLTAPASASAGAYQSNPEALAANFYADTRPFSEVTSYDNSSLNREIVKYNAGQSWFSNTKSIRTYPAPVSSDVRQYKTDASGNLTYTFYPALSLSKTLVTDEQENGETRILDSENRLVERRNIGQDIVTSYVYDEAGRLKAVIQPEGYALNASITYNSENFSRYVFFYEYDGKGRLVRKHVPGEGWTEMVYDKTDRVVMQQNPLQKVNNRWSFKEYDALDREVATGETGNNITRESAQALFDAHTVYHETLSGDTYYGLSFPSTVRPAANQAFKYNFYDTYSFAGTAFAFNSNGSYHTQKTQVKGLLAGVKKRDSRDNSKWYTEVFYYDDLNRVIQKQATHQLSTSGTTNVIIRNYEYNFAGEVISENIRYPFTTGTIEVKNKSQYDHAGRITRSGVGINAEPSDIIHYDYDEIGRLKQKKYTGAGTTPPADPCDALTDGLVMGTWTVTGHPLIARYFHNKWWLIQKIGTSPERFVVRGSEMLSRSDVTLNNPGYSSLVNCFEWKYSDYGGLMPPATPSVFPVPSGYSYVSENGEDFFEANSSVPCSTPAAIVASVTSPAVNQQVTLSTSCSTGSPKWSTNATTNSITVTATTSPVTYSVTCQGSSCTTSTSVSITVTGVPSGPCAVLTDGLVMGTWTVTNHPLIARYFHNKWWLIQRIGTSPERFIVRASEMLSRSDVTLNDPGYSSLVSCFEWQYSDYGGLVPPATPSVFAVPSGYSYVSENGEEFFQANSSVPCSTPAAIVASVTSPAVNQQVTLSTSCSTGSPKWSTNATTNSITVTATASPVTYSVTCQGSSCTTSASVSITVTGVPSGPCAVLTDGLVMGTWTVTNHPLIARYFHNKWWLIQRIGTSPERFIVRASEMLSRSDVTLNDPGYSSLVSCFEWQYSDYGGLVPPATPSVFAVPPGYSYVSENGEDFFQQNQGARMAAGFTGNTEWTESGIKLFPNPAGDRFDLRVSSIQAVKDVLLSITDMKGRVIYSGRVDLRAGENTYPVNSSSFPDGTYLVSLNKGLYSKSTKVVIMR